MKKLIETIKHSDSFWSYFNVFVFALGIYLAIEFIHWIYILIKLS